MRFGLVLLLLLPAFGRAEDAVQHDVRAVLDKQVSDWNRGDIPAFVQSYAADCTFIGKSVAQGRAAVEERYHRAYSTPAAMGHLAFSDLKIKKIDGRVAIVTGAYHLQRSAAGGGDANGLFSLVFERQSGIWRIVLDHTS